MNAFPKRASMALSGAGVIALGAFILFKIASTGHALPDPEDVGAPMPPRDIYSPTRAPASPAPGNLSTDLLDRVDLREDAISGPWGFYHRALFTDGLAYGRVQLPCEPPEEYDLRINVTRKQGDDSFIIGFVYQGRQGTLCLDGFGSTASWIGLSRPGGDLRFNETRVPGRCLRRNLPAIVLLSVRKDGVKALVDGKPLLEWRGDAAELDSEAGFRIPNTRALSVACWMSVFRIDEISLTPVNGTPKFLR